MSDDTVKEEKKLLAHHEQLPLCTSRLPYRQGRKLTAVKVYTINNESNHLLVFGVPSLNLRQEAKSLFVKFGKLLHFIVSTTHPAEDFTETYHARYERIQSARIAKRMIDTKNFYGGSLHVCYAPEFETIEETRTKLLQRKKDVTFRLRNLKKEAKEVTTPCNQKEIATGDRNKIENDFSSVTSFQSGVSSIINEINSGAMEDNSDNNQRKRMNMGEENFIYLNKQKRKTSSNVIIEKRFKPCFIENDSTKNTIQDTCVNKLELVDCTSVEKDIVSNINEALNYNKFGSEIIRQVEVKPLNRIIFKNNKKS